MYWCEIFDQEFCLNIIIIGLIMPWLQIKIGIHIFQELALQDNHDIQYSWMELYRSTYIGQHAFKTYSHPCEAEFPFILPT